MLTTEPGAPEEMTNVELRSAYLAMSHEVGDPEVERLTAEMATRELDF